MVASLIKVIAFDGVQEVARYSLAPGGYTIGRGAGCDLQLQIEGLSREHARLRVAEDGSVSIEDAASANGTYLDGERVEGATRVLPNQALQLGNISLLIQPQIEFAASALPDEHAQTEAALPPEFQRSERYDVGDEIARGGMGAVLNARQVTIRRPVALKRILGEASANPKQRLRFIEEAQITGQLEHPNIVPVYDLAADERGQPYYTMKLVQGITLKKVLDLLAKGIPATVAKYPLSMLLTVFQKVCDAVAFAHSKGVIHRDLKPANIMIGHFGEVLVMDWGLAKIVGECAPGAVGGSGTPDVRGPSAQASLVESARRDEAESFGTMAGAVMGTPHYMAPEQARGELEKLDARSDVFTLGVILYEILALERPFGGRNAAEIMEKIVVAEFVPPAQRVLASTRNRRAAAGGPTQTPVAATPPTEVAPPPPRATNAPAHLPGGRVPESLNAIVLKALAHSRSQRYQGVKNLQADLLAYQTGFATGAEKAGVSKQLVLALKRHKAVSIATAAAFVILVAVSATFTMKVIGERNRANRALADLRQAAPTLAAEARKLIDEQQFDDALIKIRFACEIDRDNVGYRLLLAQLLQARLELRPAADEFRRVLELGPNDSALANLALCERLLREYPPPAPLDHVALAALHAQMERERRFTQAAPFATKLGKSKQAVDAVLQAKLIEWRKIPGWDQRSESERWGWLPDGTLQLIFHGTLLDDLKSVRDLPITILGIGHTRVADLSPLEGMRLREIHMAELEIRDLSPLKEMPLEGLNLQALKGSPDLGPLAGMKLKRLELTYGGRRDLSILQGMPLSEVQLGGNSFTSIAFLAGAPITYLSLDRCGKLTDISAVRMMPLKRADFAGCNALRDFTPLLDCPTLEKVSIPHGVKEVEVLRRHPSLHSIGYDYDLEKSKPVAEFWAEYDAQGGGKK